LEEKLLITKPSSYSKRKCNDDYMGFGFISSEKDSSLRIVWFVQQRFQTRQWCRVSLHDVW